MIKTVNFIKSKLRIVLIIGFICTVVLGGVLLTGGLTKPSSPQNPTTYNAEILFKNKTTYVGDNSKVVAIIDNLPYAVLRKEVSLQTQTIPYGVTVNYDFSNVGTNIQQIESTLRSNAIIMFALIDNVDVITFKDRGVGQLPKYQYLRAEVQKNLEQDIRQYAKDIKTFEAFIKNPQSQKTKTIDTAVSLAIKGQRKSYFDGEVATEGHIILDTEEKNGTVKAYTIASLGAFGFENGIFTKVSGSGAIPTVMVFSKNKNGEYSLLEYKEPEDGAGYLGSIKKMFPHQLQDKVLSAQDDYSDLIKQQEKQAAEYLKSIGRGAKVSANNVEKERVDINVQASNKLFSEFTKYDSFLNNCPYWIGTRERIENGVRYIYETSQSKTNDGYDLITFRKAKEDGTVVEEQKYKIIGSEPQLID